MNVTTNLAAMLNVSESQMMSYQEILYRTNENSLEDYWEYRVSNIISATVIPVLTGLGIVGNCLSVTVLLCCKMPRSTTLTYMTALSMYDAVAESINFIMFTWGVQDGRTLYSRFTCATLFFLFFLSVHSSVMVTVAMTTERYLMIKYHLKASYLFTIRRARMAVGIVTVVALFVNIHNCFTRGYSWNDTLKTNVCGAVGEAGELFLHLIWPWVDASVYCYIPFLALLVLNILIISNVNQSSELSLRLSMSHSRRLIENRQITLMLLFVTLAFLALVGPMGVILAVEQNLLATGSALVKARHSLVRVIFNCLTYTNHAVNFLLYCISGRRFRKEVLRLFCRVHPTPKLVYNTNKE